ncbi:DUF2339 domain-containing protein [Janthinobacterium sp. PLB04]|uniref:DUF2339 domain-containing protein n=1 Tax=Janthinobacterium lividum TaxID=29581 RepID=A0AAJ4MQM9_9BURK|nr:MULTISPECIES: DUF2339 domain-containing protein [Janthinobacterium]KAB0326227.1 DUF2339 domain-containing protein [Janthinobacterium lividum]QSX95354.1 DUF2339 domain-containing protein [Janthinobacterium lividum]UGQ35189.1 DUF2339 domain-containing protein [Janthinobacterium sp. PLB04]
MSGFTSLTILALLVTAFVLVLQHRRKVADLELLTARLRKEVDSIQQRLRALEGQAEAPAATSVVAVAPSVPASVAPVAVPAPMPPPTPAPVPQAAALKVAEVAQAAPAAAPAPAAPVPPKPAPPIPARPAPAVPDTPSWIAHPDGLVAKAKNWLFTGNLVAKLGLLILFLGVSFLLKYVSAQVTLPIELRLAGIALADIALLAWAWRIRLSRPGISLPLQGTALAILMLVTFGAFRLYELIPAGLAFAVLFVLTAFTCLLAVLQNAVWLAVFGIVGGFAVPLLVSTGSGNHIGLFSYYALLNAGVFAIALKRAWRVLNVLSFGFTFVVATTWGLLRYTPEHYLSTQLFLILFVLFYVGIAIAYCARQAPRLKHYVDGTLVFGTPLAAMGLQYGLVQHFHFGLAFSALIAGLGYTGLAVALWRRAGFKLLAEAFLALGIVFGTLAIPFALDGRWTSAAWALEGAGIVWVGLRQRQTLAWAFGLLVQGAAWIAFLIAMQELDTAAALHANIWLGCALLAAAALVMAYNFRRHASHLHPEFMSSLSVLFLTAAAAWLLGGIWSEILLRTDATTQLNLLTVSALAVAALLAALARREQWHAPRALLLAVQVLAGMVMLSRANWAWDQHPASLFDGSFLSALLLGAAAFASAHFLALRARGGDELLALAARPLLVWSGLLWFAAILVPLVSWLLRLIDGDLELQPHAGEQWLALYLIAVCVTTPAFAILARRLDWPQLRWFTVATWLGLGLWSANMLLALYLRDYLPTGLSWLALASALAAGEYLLLAWPQAGWQLGLRAQRLLHTLRTAAPWLMLWPVGAMHVNAWLAQHEDRVSPAWARYLPAWAMMLVLALLIRRCRAGAWPVAPIAEWYQRTLIPLGALWSLLLIAAWNIFDDGAMAPLPYLPLLNPLDLSTGFAILLAIASYRLLPAKQLPLPALWQARLPAVAACCVYVWFNLMLLRTVSHYVGVPYTFDAMLASQFVQAMLSLVWSITALLLMRHAARHQRRQQWSMGAVLLGLVVLKLFLIDLSNVGGIERIISFVGVGLLMVLIGYLAPFPKAAAPAPAEPQQGAA